MKKIGKITLKYIIIYLLIIMSFLLLLTVVSLIPKSSIEENVKETAQILNEQTNSYMVKVRKWEIMFDNYSDALMINTAYSIDNKEAFYSAMVARKNYIPGLTKTICPDKIGGIGYSSRYKHLDQVRRIK